MQAKKYARFLLTAILAAALVWLSALYVLPAVLPFLIGLAIAMLVEKPLRVFLEKTKLPRPAGVFLFVLLFYALLILAVYFLCRIITTQATRFLKELPQLLSSLAIPFGTMQRKLYDLAKRLPDGVGVAVREGVDSFFKNGALIGSRIYDWLFETATNVLGKLPDILLFLITTVVASFLATAELPALRAFVREHASARYLGKLRALRTRLKQTLGGYMQAQLKLMGITFLILTAGLLILRIPYAFLFALLIAVLDALPVFGVGTVLLPWSLLSFLRADLRLGVGLLILYACAALTRQALEPKMVGQHIGLNPLVTLMALYLGFRCAGILGMILFPLAAIFLKQLLPLTLPQSGNGAGAVKPDTSG